MVEEGMGASKPFHSEERKPPKTELPEVPEWRKAKARPIVEPPAEPPRPSFKERVKTRYETVRQERAIAKSPGARKARIKERKEATDLTRQELNIRGVERQQRIRRIKESRVGYSMGVASQVAQSVDRRTAQRRYPSQRYRPRGFDQRTAYAGGLTGLQISYGGAQRYGATRPGLSSPQVPLPTHSHIYSMGGISSGGAVGRGYEPQRTERQAIPRGTIKSYWSKKVKSLAKTNVRKYGPDEGIERTRELATELGWKMQ